MARDTASVLSRHALRRLSRAPFAGLRRLWNRTKPDPGPEAPGIAVGRVIALVAGWALFLCVSLVGFGWYTLSRIKLDSPAQAVSAPPAPRLQVDPASDYDRLTRLQTQRLGAYAWVDRASGTVEVPIERAMAILSAKGPAALEPLIRVAPADAARSRAVDAAVRAGASR